MNTTGFTFTYKSSQSLFFFLSNFVSDSKVFRGLFIAPEVYYHWKDHDSHLPYLYCVLLFMWLNPSYFPHNKVFKTVRFFSNFCSDQEMGMAVYSQILGEIFVIKSAAVTMFFFSLSWGNFRKLYSFSICTSSSFFSRYLSIVHALICSIS